MKEKLYFKDLSLPLQLAAIGMIIQFLQAVIVIPLLIVGALAYFGLA